MKVLVMCHGNINRSPLCAAVLRESLGKDAVQSAGFVNPGRPAAKKMRDQAAERGYRLLSHRSQLLTDELLLWADRVVYMDGGNLKRLKTFPAFDTKKTICLGRYCVPLQNRIPDPNFMRKGSPDFIFVVEMIIAASKRLAQSLGEP